MNPLFQQMLSRYQINVYIFFLKMIGLPGVLL